MTHGVLELHALEPATAPASAGRLLEQGRYDEAALAMLTLERRYREAGATGAAKVLGAARQLCQACNVYRSEVKAQRRAALLAAEREQTLRDRLRAILDLAASGTTVDAPLPAEPASRVAAGAAPLLAIHCLGPLRIYRDDRELGPCPNRRAKSVLKFLVVNRGRAIPKDILMELFWPDAEPGAARNNLNVAVYGLRRYLRTGEAGVSHVLFQDNCYRLNPDLHVWVDLEEFKRLVDSATTLEREGDTAAAMRDLQAAAALYHGGLFDDDPYEDWMLPLRRDLQDTFLAALERLRDHQLAAGDYGACIAVSRRMLAVEPYRENVHRELMRCHARQDHRSLALRQFLDCRETLRRALDADPSQETVRLFERIRDHEPV
jgi:DNA-binding SARP family transcriptional activator